MEARLCAIVAAAAVFVCSCIMPSHQETAPASPKNVRIVAGSPPSVAWDPVPGAELYKVYCSSCPECWPPLEDQNTTSTQVECRSEGYYSVSAVNSGGESARSASPVLYGPPEAPEGVRIEKDDNGDHYLRWNEVYGATSYTIYRSTICHPDPFPPADAIVGLTATGYQLMAAGYCYWVAAVASGGESEISGSEVAYY